MRDILVVGSLNMDLIIETKKLPVMGETVIGGGFLTVPGGKGANQAIAAARLNASTAIIGSVGMDAFGDELIKSLVESGVDVTNLNREAGVSTGVADIILKDGDNCIIVDQGANALLTPDKISRELISSSKIILVQLEIPIDTVAKVLKLARECGKTVILNPAPACHVPDELLKLVDILTPNEFECETITGMPAATPEEAMAAIRFLLEKGVPQVIVTMGSQGSVYNSGEKLIHMPAKKVKVVDTTAAGDSFSGAIAAGMAWGWDIDKSVLFASNVSSLTVRTKGAQSSLPKLEAVEREMLL